MRYFQDIVPGETREFGRKIVTREEIIAFAREYDPQPHHLDEIAAKQSMLGSLCASGWHGCAMLMRMLVDDFEGRLASLGGAGVEETRWVKPILPGDILRVRTTVLDSRISRSKPWMGLVRMRYELLDQSDTVKLSQTGVALVAVRGVEPRP